MRGQLFLVVGGAIIAVGALGIGATAAYGAPPSTTSSAVSHAPSLVVPANYHPTFSSNHPVAAAGGLTAVAPRSAINLTHAARQPSIQATPEPSATAAPVPAPAPAADSVPPSAPVQTVPVKGGTPGNNSSSNSGNDVNNKGDASNKGKNNKDKTNNGNDVDNKGTGSNTGDGSNKGKGSSDG